MSSYQFLNIDKDAILQSEEKNMDQNNSDHVDNGLESMEIKAEKNRERNREHAKRTRLRKKEMIEGMKMRLLELQREVCHILP
jgi:hypothetical protein